MDQLATYSDSGEEAPAAASLGCAPSTTEGAHISDKQGPSAPGQRRESGQHRQAFREGRQEYRARPDHHHQGSSSSRQQGSYRPDRRHDRPAQSSRSPDRLYDRQSSHSEQWGRQDQRHQSAPEWRGRYRDGWSGKQDDRSSGRRGGASQHEARDDHPRPRRSRSRDRRSRSRSRGRHRRSRSRDRRSRSRDRRSRSRDRRSRSPGHRSDGRKSGGLGSAQPPPAPLVVSRVTPGIPTPLPVCSTPMDPAEMVRRMMSAPGVTPVVTTSGVSTAGMTAAQKRALLWGSKKAEATVVKATASAVMAAPEAAAEPAPGSSSGGVAAAVFGTNRWDAAEFSSEAERAKFLKIMGVKGAPEVLQGSAAQPAPAEHQAMTRDVQDKVLSEIEGVYARGLAQTGKTYGLGAF